MTAERLEAPDAERRQRAVAGAVTARGLGPGDRVAFLLPPSADLLCAALGCLRRGVFPVMLNPELTAGERGALVEDADAAMVVDSEEHLAELVAAPGADLAPHPLGRPVHYTSGTTGRAKGVYSGVLSESAARAQFDEEAELWGFGASDVLLVCSPMHHSAPLRFSTGVLLSGGTVVVLDRFGPAAVAAAVREHGVTTAFMVPAHLQRLDAAGLLEPGLLSGFRLLAHAGAPCPEPLKRRALAAFPTGSVWEFYGSTEGQFTSCGPEEWMDRPGTVGRARPGRSLFVDGDGLIWCAPPDHAHFTYWRDPAKTAAAWRGGDGGPDRFTVGDLGRIDAEGYLWIDARRDDLVISGGMNVYPAEVEEALLSDPGVVEVAVFGVSDERWGQRVCAAYVGTASSDDLAAAARERLAPYKRPKEFHRVQALPHTSTGKLRRGAVAAQLGLGPTTGA